MLKKKNILFFCPLPPPITGQAVMSEIIQQAIKPTYTINTNLNNKLIGTFRVLIQTFFTLTFYKIDTVYFTATRSKFGALKDIWLLLLCKLKKVKVINHFHGNDISKLFTNKLFSKIVTWAYQQINTSIFVTKYQQELLPNYFPVMKKITIYNCYNSFLEEKNNHCLIKNCERINLLFLSNIMKSKGIFVLLSAIEEILDENSRVVLHIAGDSFSDPEYFLSKKYIQKKFQGKISKIQKKFPNQLIYHGQIEQNRKKKLLLSSQILIFPSLKESFGLVIIEAMITGNAIITTNLPHINEIIGKEEGVLVEPNDINSLQNGIRTLLNDKDRVTEMQKHNINYAKKFSPAEYLSKMKEIILT